MTQDENVPQRARVAQPRSRMAGALLAIAAIFVFAVALYLFLARDQLFGPDEAPPAAAVDTTAPAPAAAD